MLFRQEAIDQSANRLYGGELILPKISFLAIGTFLAIWVIFLVSWLMTSHYSKRTLVSGWLETTDEIVKIYLLVPVEAAANVTEGQSFEIRYDATLNQKYASSRIRVIRIPDSIWVASESDPIHMDLNTQAYKIEAILDDSVSPHNQIIPLKSGVTLQADILSRDKALMAWLLELI
ncbi:MAG: hypothetical protein ACJAYF_003664 [Arenicella sp.]|jgi:hypothetical protein